MIASRSGRKTGAPGLTWIAALLWLALGCSEPAKPPELPALRAPDLAALPPVRLDDPRLVAVRHWGDGPSFLLFVHGLGSEVRAFEVASAAGDPSELRIEGCERLIDAVSDAGERFALCAGAGALHLHRRARGGADWTYETVLEKLPIEAAEGFHGLAIHAGRQAIVGPSALLWRATRDAAWQTFSLAPIDPSLRLETEALVTSTAKAVWIGYDHGEFGGGLYRAPLDPNGQLRTLEPLLERNVVGIGAAGDRGGVWVAGGLAHLFMAMAFLVRIEGSSLASIVAQDDRDSPALRRELSTPSHQLPPDTWFSAFALSPRGTPLVMDPARGIYEFSEDAFGMGTLRMRVEGMKTLDVAYGNGIATRSYRRFLELADGSFVLTTNDGEVVVVSHDATPRSLSLPGGSGTPSHSETAALLTLPAENR